MVNLQAIAQGALPQNAVRSWKSLLDLASDAWHGIGDTSTDVKKFMMKSSYDYLLI